MPPYKIDQSYKDLGFLPTDTGESRERAQSAQRNSGADFYYSYSVGVWSSLY